MKVDKVDFIKTFIDDVLSDSALTWAQYSDNYNISSEQLRGTWRYFKKRKLPEGVWPNGKELSPEWEDKAKRAVHIRDGGDPSIPSNMSPQWLTQELKDGEYVVTKKTYKKDNNSEVADNLEKTIAKYKEIVKQAEIAPYIIIPKKSNKKTLQILTADKHVGATNTSSLFGNEYDSKIFEARMRKILETIEKLKTIYGRFDHIDIVDLGDGADGYNKQTSRGGHELIQNLAPDEQFDVYVNGHNRLFDNLARGDYANKYSFIVAANDNHNGVSWMYPCARGTEIFLNAKYPEIETIVAKEFLFNIKRGRHVIMFTHGKDEKFMKSGMPFKLDAKTKTFVNAYIDYNNLSRHIPFNQEKLFIHLMKGDLHQSGEEYGERFRYKNVMSFFGASDYIEYNYTRGYSYKGFEWQVIYNEEPETHKGSEFFFK